MRKYLIQYVPGSQELVHDCLTRTLGASRVSYVDDSAMVFESNIRIQTSAQLPFAKNVYVVLAGAPRRSLNRSIQQLTSLVSKVQLPAQAGGKPGFRVMFQIDGSLVAPDRAVRVGMERAISLRTRSRLEPRGSCQEYWVIGRKGLNQLLLCMRLPKPNRVDRPKGALSFELSALLVAASHPKRNEVLLDPFAGSGALVQASLELSLKRVIYSDTALAKLLPSLPRRIKSDPRVQLLSEDGARLPSIRDHEVDVIVTDPPWGEYEKLDRPYHSFAEEVAASFNRVLSQKSGRFVLLSSRRNADLFVERLGHYGFKIWATPGILVGGNPATVIIGGR